MEHIRHILDSVLPGAVPATVATIGLSVGGQAGAPGWLIAVGQALIVAIWCSSAIQRRMHSVDERLGTIEAAVKDLECVRRQRVAGFLGTPVPSLSCLVPPPKG